MEEPRKADPDPEPISEGERTRVSAALERLRRMLEVPDDVTAYAPLLPLVLVAWADGTIQDGEAARIREAASRTRLPDAVAFVDRLLRTRPGPFFRHRVVHLLQALRLEDRIPEEKATEILEEARAVAEAAGGFLGFGRISEEESLVLDDLERALGTTVDAVRRMRGERRTLPIVPEWLDLARPPRKEVHVHLAHDSIVQVVAIHLAVHRTPERPWKPVLVSLDPLQNASELDPVDVRRTLEQNAHLSESERWAVLLGEIGRIARPIDPVFRAELLAEARGAGATGEDFVVVDGPELYEVQETLASTSHWVAWHAGKLEELLVDPELVRRRLAPGTFEAPRAEVTWRREEPFTPVDLGGLRFRRLVLDAPGRSSLRLAAPELPTELSDPAIAWIARNLPVLRDPYATLLLDVKPGDRAQWTVDVRSTLPANYDDHAEPLPPGRSLVVPPWIWDRVSHALSS